MSKSDCRVFPLVYKQELAFACLFVLYSRPNCWMDQDKSYIFGILGVTQVSSHNFFSKIPIFKRVQKNGEIIPKYCFVSSPKCGRTDRAAPGLSASGLYKAAMTCTLVLCQHFKHRRLFVEPSMTLSKIRPVGTLFYLIFYILLPSEMGPVSTI